MNQNKDSLKNTVQSFLCGDLKTNKLKLSDFIDEAFLEDIDNDMQYEMDSN